MLNSAMLESSVHTKPIIKCRPMCIITTFHRCISIHHITTNILRMPNEGNRNPRASECTKPYPELLTQILSTENRKTIPHLKICAATTSNEQSISCERQSWARLLRTFSSYIRYTTLRVSRCRSHLRPTPKSLESVPL